MNNVIDRDELSRLRLETKGTAGKIHFNNAGAALPPDVVTEAVINYLEEEAINGGYETEAKRRDEIEKVYDSIARFINAERNEVAITESASMAWGLAFNGIEFSEGDIILTSEFEYITNLLGLLDAGKSKKVEIKIIPNDENGNFSYQEFLNSIGPKVKLIAVTHISSTGGGMLPIAEIGKTARENEILYLVDACQTAGQVPIDVKKIGCDILAVTGRKFLRAPRGTGFLYVRKQAQAKIKVLFMDSSTSPRNSMKDFEIRDDARRFELYEKNRALSLGLGKAIEYAMEIGMERIWERIQLLAGIMRQQLHDIEGVTVHDIGDQQCGIVTFSAAGLDSAVVKSKLSELNINVWVGAGRSSFIYMTKHNLSSVVRASVHYYNSEEEIVKMIEAIKTF